MSLGTTYFSFERGVGFLATSAEGRGWGKARFGGRLADRSEAPWGLVPAATRVYQSTCARGLTALKPDSHRISLCDVASNISPVSKFSGSECVGSIIPEPWSGGRRRRRFVGCSSPRPCEALNSEWATGTPGRCFFVKTLRWEVHPLGRTPLRSSSGSCMRPPRPVKSCCLATTHV